MVKHAGSAIHKSLDNFLLIAIEHLQYNEDMPTTLTVCNNACWFIGQVCDSEPARSSIIPYIQQISDKIVAMLMV